MGKRIKNYRKRIDELLASSAETDWDSAINEHIQQIAFFQHERLIHLIVTMTMSILALLSMGTALISDNPLVLLLTLMFAVLLIPYILHYYLLENETQKMYRQYDIMLEKRNENRLRKTETD